MISMKKIKRNCILFFAVVSIVLFYSPSNIKAQLTQDSTTTAPRKENVQNRVDVRNNRRNEPGLDIKENVQMRKENVANRQEIRSKRKEEFQKRIVTIKDEKKQVLVERLDGKFTALNLRQTTRMKERLDRLTSIVSRLQNRVNQLKTNGQNTTSAETALTTAQTAIQTSMNAVATQASKEYAPQITTEENLRQTVGITSQQLKTDLTTTHKTVITAHQAVVKAHQSIVALRELPISPAKEVEITETPVVETPTIIPSISSVQ